MNGVTEVYAGRLAWAFMVAGPEREACRNVARLLGVTRSDARTLVREARRIESRERGA